MQNVRSEKHIFSARHAFRPYLRIRNGVYTVSFCFRENSGIWAEPSTAGQDLLPLTFNNRCNNNHTWRTGGPPWYTLILLLQTTLYFFLADSCADDDNQWIIKKALHSHTTTSSTTWESQVKNMLFFILITWFAQIISFEWVLNPLFFLRIHTTRMNHRLFYLVFFD